MVRKATNASVSDIEVVVERPQDRDRLNDAVRSDKATENISGSGGSAVLVTNNSTGNWYCEAVSASALGVTTPGVVTVDVAIRNSSDSVIAEQTFDITESQVDFGGLVIKPGWDVHYTVAQDDSTSYAVVIEPLIRKPQPGSSTGSPETGENTTTIDSFEDGGITEYSGDTGNFSVITSDTYHLGNALECSNSSFSSIRSTSGLENYPSEGDTFAYNTKATAGGGGSGNEMRINGRFNIEDASNTWAVRLNYEHKTSYFLEQESGSTTTVAQEFIGGLDPDEWHEVQVDWGASQIEVTVFDPNGVSLGGYTVATADLNRTSEFNGWGWGARANVTSESVRMDNARIL